MHTHLELVIPPVKNMEKFVDEILYPLNEMFEDNEYTFYDWYEIGGRWDNGNNVKKFSETIKTMQCSHVIFSYIDCETGEPKISYMVQDFMWNGTNLVETKWDKTFGGATSMFIDYANRQKWGEKIIPKDDWIVITIDYHS